MNSETPPSSDPLFGNNASALLHEAIDPSSRVPTGDPRYWQPPTPEELQARLGGAYTIEAFLARGGMGAVYRGIQVSLERPVAIKILPPQLRDADPSFAQRFKQEAKAMAQLNHPSIVSVYDFGEMPDGTLYFIMEFIDGTDVAHMVARKGRLSSQNAMAITAHVCDALQYAHENGVVHRDIKPANIMVGHDGRVKVADFGLAKSSRVTQSSLTMTGHVMGTPHFLAPEALTLGSTVDHRADIYAVGVMLYQMLTGKLPQGIFEMPSLLVPGLDPRYDAIIAAAMREDRTARYQAILDMRRALDAILTKPVTKSQATPQQSAAVPAQATAPKPQPGQHYYRPPQAAKPAPVIKPKSSTGTWLLAAAVVLSLGGIVWMKMGNSAPPSTPPPLAESAAVSPDTASTNPIGAIGDLVFPIAAFERASISECIEYFQIKSRDLDPAKKGMTFLVDEATRKSKASISIDLKQIRLADLIECFARVARLEVSYVGEAVQLKSSTSVKPPFSLGKPTAKLQQIGETIFTNLRFQKATLEEACEFLRVKGKDISGQPVNLILDPEFTRRKHEITMDMTQVSLANLLIYITDMCDAEVACLADVFYIQPRTASSEKPAFLSEKPSAKLQQLGEAIIPLMDFRNASIDEACEYIRIKSKDITGQRVRLVMSGKLAQPGHKITVYAARVSLSTALTYIADLCDAEVAYIAEDIYLRPRSSKPEEAVTNASGLFGEAGKAIFPTVRFTNATIDEAAEYLRIKSRDLDPQKKGMVILLDEAASRAAGSITLDSRNISGATAITQIAALAGLQMHRVGEAVRLRAPANAQTKIGAQTKPKTSASALPAATSNETGFVPLLDKDHFGFWKQAGKGTAELKNGILFPSNSKESGAQCLWYSERAFTDFTLKVEFYLHDRNANTGVMVRFPDPGNDGSVPNMKGYEIDIAPRATADIWRWLGGSSDDHIAASRPVKYDDWNLYEITVIGHKYTVKLNGQIVNEYEGHVGLRGYVGLQNCTPSGGVGFRNVRIKELSSSSSPITTTNSSPEFRTFTDARGRTTRAALVRVQNDEVTLKTESGEEHTFKAAAFSAADIEYFKTKGLVMPQTPAVAAAAAPSAPKPPTAVVEPPKPAAVPAPSAPTTYGGMEFSPNWLPQTLTAKRELLETFDFYCKAVVGNAPKGQEPVPATIVGAIRWRMPIDEAIRTLPKGYDKLAERPMVHTCLPNGSLINCGFQYRSFQDRGQSFREMFMLIDKQRRVVSVMFRDNGKDIKWFPQPDGIREPYYNLINLTNNGSNTQEVPYQIFDPGSGSTCIKTALRKKIIALPNMPNMPQMAPAGGETKENVHWYIPAPFARSILDIVEVYRKAGVIK